MCCITIETEVILANIFGSPELAVAREEGVDISIIEKCATVLANNLPGYVFFDVTLDALANVSKENPEFVLEKNQIYYFGLRIQREHYNRVYSVTLAKKISSLVDCFFKYKLYERPISRLEPAMA